MSSANLHLHTPVTQRRFPYPYRAALTICSDIDETQSVDEFLAIQKFLNTTGPTEMGSGVGLDIGNSFYFYDDDREFSWFTHDDSARQVIIDMIHAGYIDSLHSFGDAVNGPDSINRALDALNDADCKLDVWINHYGSPSNISRHFEYLLGPCQGAVPDTPFYHTDRTLDYGIRFASVGATTRVIGQSHGETRGDLRTIFDRRVPVRAALNMAKELRKQVLGRRGDTRFATHGANRVTNVLTLEDGRRVHEVLRYCNHDIDIPHGATSRGLAYAISPRALERLKAVEGFSVVYTHLGKNSDTTQPIAPETQSALRNLAREYRAGNIFVTTTSRLLNYYTAFENLAWSQQVVNDRTHIVIEGIDDPIRGLLPATHAALQGLTFYVPDGDSADIFLAGERFDQVQRNPADHTGQPSVTIPIIPLTFPY